MRSRVIAIVSHSHSRCSTVSLPLRHLQHKGVLSFPILCKSPYSSRCLVSRSTKIHSCCLIMLSSLVAFLFLSPSMSALESLQSFLDFQHSMCFLSIQSPIARLITLYGRRSKGSGPVNGLYAPFLAS